MDEDVVSILCVDDDENILYIIQEMLFSNFDVYTANNISAAKEIFIKKNPDIVITDMKFGLEFLKFVRDNEEIKNETPVILMSALSENRIHVSSTGFDGFVSKPFSRTSLIHRIKDVMVKKIVGND
jgi:DNA-binding response OmpR family regulator